MSGKKSAVVKIEDEWGMLDRSEFSFARHLYRIWCVEISHQRGSIFYRVATPRWEDLMREACQKNKVRWYCQPGTYNITLTMTRKTYNSLQKEFEGVY